MAERASPRGGAKQGGQPKPWDGRTPISVAAGLILLVAVLPKVIVSSKPAVCCGTWRMEPAEQRCAPGATWGLLQCCR